MQTRGNPRGDVGYEGVGHSLDKLEATTVGGGCQLVKIFFGESSKSTAKFISKGSGDYSTRTPDRGNNKCIEGQIFIFRLS